MCTSTTIDGRKEMRHARRLVKDKFDLKDGHQSQEPLVTGSRLPIPDFPRPKPGGKRISSSSSSEEAAAATQEPERRLLVSNDPITNNGGDGVGNGHNGRHPRSVPVPSTTKASTRGPIQTTTTTASGSSTATTTTTTTTTSPPSGLRRLQRGGNPGDENGNGRNSGNGRSGFPPRPSNGRPLPEPRPEIPRPPHFPIDSSEDSNEVSTTEALDDQFGRNFNDDESKH